MNPAPPRKHPLRSYRLYSPVQYRRVKAEGRVLRKFPITMRTLQADDILESRIGYVIRRQAGMAVARNIWRRILRETFRAARPRFHRPAWVVFEVSDKVSETTRLTFNQTAAALVENLCRGAA